MVFAATKTIKHNIQYIFIFKSLSKKLHNMKGSPGKDDWFVVVNPNAGNKKGYKDWNRIAGIFKDNNIPYSVKITEKRGQAIDFTRKAIKEGHRKIVSVGGDGTLNEVVNGVFIQNHCASRDIILGMIPVGTGNDWGRMFGIPLVYEGAVQLIKECKTMLHDIGLVTYYNGPHQEKRYFINIAGVGFEAEVIRKTNKQKEKGKSNKAIYFYSLLSSLISLKIQEATVTVDGMENTSDIFSVNIGNGRYCGGGMRQTPDALPDDGLLDITVIKGMGRIEIIKALKILYDGTILSHPKVDGYRASHCKITSESLLYTEADGETLGHTPVEFSIIPASVNIVYGTRLIQ